MNTGQMIEIVPTHDLCGTEWGFSYNGKASPPECGCSTGDTEQVLLTGLGWRQGPCPVTIGLLSQGLEFYLLGPSFSWALKTTSVFKSLSSNRTGVNPLHCHLSLDQISCSHVTFLKIFFTQYITQIIIIMPNSVCLCRQHSQGLHICPQLCVSEMTKRVQFYILLSRTENRDSAIPCLFVF